MKKPGVTQSARRDNLRREAIDDGLARDPSFSVVALVHDLEFTAEWREAMSTPAYQKWKSSPDDVCRLKIVIATDIVRKLRTVEVRQLIESGNPFWLELATRVATSKLRWHQSGRIQASCLISLSRRLSASCISNDDQRTLRSAMTDALLLKIDCGIGEEFRSLVRVARRVATDELIAGLADRARTAERRSVRINAQRMLDYIAGHSYRRYSA